MSLNIYLVFLCASILSFAQKLEKDSLEAQKLDDVVVTGQYNPQSIKKSIYNVRVLKRKDIDRIAANNLADLLNYNLNLTVKPNSKTGQSTISFYGLNAQYFNILIDNIPLVSDTGLGNNIDLSQINLNNVAQIEIVEGAMAVEYGANAVSGVINIITKKSTKNKWEIDIGTQEETVGNEYEWFNKGRHIQMVSIRHKINKNLHTEITFNRNQFAGFFNNKKGKKHYINDGLRGYEWLPKKQLTVNTLLNYKISKNLNLLYKLQYYTEGVNFYNSSVRANINTQTQTSNPSATDRIFNSYRLVNNLGLNGKLKNGINYNLEFSYQEQRRNLSEFNYFILTDKKSNETNGTYQASNVFFSKGRINSILNNKTFNFQLGYEARFINGFDSQASGRVTQNPKKEKQNTIAVFGSTEVHLNKRLSIRPGVRYEYNSLYQSKPTGELTIRHLFKHGIEFRTNIGTTYRTPNFYELYTYFVDSNHDVQGNKYLTPEKGYSVFLNLKKQSKLNKLSIQNNIKANLIQLNDRIDLAVVNNSPLKYQYINIDSFKTIGFTTDNNIRSGPIELNIGATIQLVSQSIGGVENISNNYLLNYQINASSSYHIKKWNTVLSLLYKYNGKQDEFISSSVDTEGNPIFSKQTLNDYSWLDTSIQKSFFNKKAGLTLGVRNLLNITNVNRTGITQETMHSNTSNSSLLLGYGRSFYIKINYNLKFN